MNEKSRLTKNLLNDSSGFTLVELLIVVIILAVLAAVVVPQFSSTTQEAKETALNNNLGEVRKVVELYYHQHNSTYPGANTALGGTGGAGAAGTSAAFISQLTLYTNLAGVANSTKTAVFKYGPYLKRQTFPANPIDESTTITMVNTGDVGAGDITVVPTPGAGWWFDSVSGKFAANTTTYVDW